MQPSDEDDASLKNATPAVSTEQNLDYLGDATVDFSRGILIGCAS